jgi:hypothetical protein
VLDSPSARSTVRRRVAHQDVDLPELAYGLVDEVLELVLRRDVGRNRDRAARPSVAQIAVATAARASGLRDEITTFAPASAMRSAIALPMPRAEPVITAVLPASENKDMAGGLLAV